MGKVRMCVWIDEDIYYSFKEWVMKKHKKVQGVMGEEVGRAILLLMNLESQENSEEALLKATKPRKKYIELLKWLYNIGKLSPIITNKAIERWIREHLGVMSKSTIHSYMSFAKTFLWEERRTKGGLIEYSILLDKIEKYAKIHNIELEEPARTTVKEPEPSKVTIRGFEVSLETTSKKTPNQSALAEIVMDLYQSGYSASEIVNKLEALGLNISANRVLNIIRRELRNEFV